MQRWLVSLSHIRGECFVKFPITMSELIVFIDVLFLFISVCIRVPEVSYNQQTLLSQCNMGCSCSMKHWDPVCAYNGMTYASPCLAGCQTSSGIGKEMVSSTLYVLIEINETGILTGWASSEANKFFLCVISCDFLQNLNGE